MVRMDITDSADADTIDADAIDADTLDMDWQLTEGERDGLMASGLDPQTRLQRALHIVERAWRGEAPEEQVQVQVRATLTLDEHERTWPDARTSLVDPWYGHGDVDRANATARHWSARFLLRALGFDFIDRSDGTADR
jgi:hypothetical protein